MQFNSFVFVFAFLPVTVLLYHLANKIHYTVGKLVFIAASLVFYAYSDVSALLFIGASLAANYLCACLLRRRMDNKLSSARIFLIIPLVINIGLLVYFKYTGFILSCFNVVLDGSNTLANLILPLGISFITFQQIAYVVSVYRHEIEAVSLVDYLAYILYFPKILMGPLAEPADFIGQLNDASRKKFDSANLARGLQIFSFGLFKKVMLADVFALAVNSCFEHLNTVSSLDLVFVMLFYTFEIYFDFSGYSDMAVGSSLMLNITLPINFDSPYKALSIRDFWKRWHISLTKFFTKYLYIPLGGSRKGKLLTYVNTMIVFAVSGLWHGANWSFILWGVLHGLFMVFDRVFEKQEAKIPKPIRWLLTFALVNILWLLFRAESIPTWTRILKKIFSLSGMYISFELANNFVLPEVPFLTKLFHIGAITEAIPNFWLYFYTLAALLLCLIPKNSYRRMDKLTLSSMLLAAVVFAWSMLSLGNESLFVYFTF